MASKTAVVTRDGMVLAPGRLWDYRDLAGEWLGLRDARIDAIVANLTAQGWTVSDHRPAAQVAAAQRDIEMAVERSRWAMATLSGHEPLAA